MLYFSWLQTQLFQISKAGSTAKLLENAVLVEKVFCFQASFFHHVVLRNQMFSDPLSNLVSTYQVTLGLYQPEAHQCSQD